MANAVTLLLYNDKEEVLLQLRDEHAKKNSNKWAFFGGAIDQGETPEEAVRREAEEELHYKLRDPKLILVDEIRGDGTKYLFAEHFDKSQVLRLGEGKEMRWYGLDDMEDLAMVVSHKGRLARVVASKGF